MRTLHVRLAILLATFVAVIAVPPGLAQMNWTQLSPAHSPLKRMYHAMAYDVDRHRVVTFGGLFSPNDMWEWDGKDWIRQFPITMPADLVWHAMAYDAARRRVLLFGGLGPNFEVNDTWEWDGKDWTKLNPKTLPPPSKQHAMASDTTRKRIVLFGGSIRNDTWEWDGTDWIRCHPVTTPPDRSYHAMGYDVARQRVVLFGGMTYSSGRFNDTWEWDGINWTQRTPATSPPARQQHGLVYDEARQRVVLFGGLGQLYLNDTWEWDGTDWTQCSPATRPTERASSAMAYDSAHGCVVLFGGGCTGPTLADTWQYGPADLRASTHLVSVATGGNVTLTLDARPSNTAKNYFAVGCMDSTAVRGIQLGQLTLLLNPDPYFWFTALFPNTLIANALGQLDASGKATATVQVPGGLPTAVIGTRFYHAYVVFQSNIDYASTPVPLTFVP